MTNEIPTEQVQETANNTEERQVEQDTKTRQSFSVYDIQRRQEADFIMGRGPKPLDGSCLDRRSNGVLDD